MFDLGYKQIIINDDSVVDTTTIPGYVVVEGYGKFEAGSSTINEEGVYSPPVLGETAVSGPPSWADTQVWEIKLFIREGFSNDPAILGYSRTLGDIKPAGETIVFQTALVDPDTKVAPADFNRALEIMVNNDENSMLEFSAGTFKFKEGYEGYTISDILATKIYDKVNPVDESILPTGEYITGAVTEGLSGYGTPAQIEASVQKSTFATRDPYGIRFGGSEAIDFDAHYNSITWFTKGDHLDGTEPHNMLGYGDANTASIYADRKFVAYVKDDQSAAIAALKSI